MKMGLGNFRSKTRYDVIMWVYATDENGTLEGVADSGADPKQAGGKARLDHDLFFKGIAPLSKNWFQPLLFLASPKGEPFWRSSGAEIENVSSVFGTEICPTNSSRPRREPHSFCKKDFI